MPSMVGRAAGLGGLRGTTMNPNPSSADGQTRRQEKLEALEELEQKQIERRAAGHKARDAKRPSVVERYRGRRAFQRGRTDMAQRGYKIEAVIAGKAGLPSWRQAYVVTYRRVGAGLSD